jgi:hypothetical protein
MQEPRTVHAAARLKDGRVLLVGTAGVLPAEIYDPLKGTFATTGSLTHSRTGPAAITLLDGRVLVVGAADEPDATDAGAELYDPGSGKFTPTGRLAINRTGAAVTLLKDGRVLVAGGQDVRSGRYVASAEVLDPVSGKFASTGSMKAARENATATLLSDGRALIAGGDRGAAGPDQTILATAEIYDPGSGKFSPAGSMTTERVFHTATALSDGRVLITGGWSFRLGAQVSSAEVFDPNSGSFAATGSMTTSRGYHSAIRLLSGKVLVVGGLNQDSPVDGVASADLYDPTTGVFALTGAMHEPRWSFTVTLLEDGEVLVAGSGGGGDYTSCELYRP